MNKCPVCGKDVLRKSSKVIYCNDSCKYKAYALRNPERVKESQKRYNTNNYQKRLETWKKYRIKTGRSKTIWTEDRINTCMECNIKFKPDKFHPYMKFHSLACEAKYKSRKWKQMHPQRVKESMRKYDHSLKGKERRERRKVKCKIYSKQWFIKNPDKCAEYSKRYREKDPERAKKVRKTYAQSMKGILANREKSRVRRSVFIKQKCDHNYWRSIVKEQNYKCPLCGAEYGEQIRNMALGHIFPRSKFPKLDSEVNNIIPICRKCNSKMYNMLFSDFCIKYNYPIPKRVLQYIKKNKSLLNF